VLDLSFSYERPSDGHEHEQIGHVLLLAPVQSPVTLSAELCAHSGHLEAIALVEPAKRGQRGLIIINNDDVVACSSFHCL